MINKKYQDLPKYMKNCHVKKYFDLLEKKKKQIIYKRSFDLIGSIVGSVVLLPAIFVIGVLIKIDSKGPILFKQVRVTRYGKEFKIFKFRTMVVNAENLGAQVTSKNDDRITRIGRKLRKYRLDELPQIFNILLGDLSFVGTRPEVPKYVDRYSEEMYATLLMPAGVTSEASLKFKDEDKILDNVDSKYVDVEDRYIYEVLPVKMDYNLNYINSFSFTKDMKIIIDTIIEVLFNRDSNEDLDIPM